MEVTFGQDWKGRWGGLHPLACESWSVLKGHQCSERGGQGWGENVTWHGVWGNWNKERMELDKEPRTLALLLIRFTVRNFSWCQTGLYKKKKKISLEQGFSKLWGISICVPWCLLLVRTDLYQPECWENSFTQSEADFLLTGFLRTFIMQITSLIFLYLTVYSRTVKSCSPPWLGHSSKGCYLNTYTISSISLLRLQSLEYFLCGPLQRKFAYLCFSSAPSSRMWLLSTCIVVSLNWDVLCLHLPILEFKDLVLKIS